MEHPKRNSNEGHSRLVWPMQIRPPSRDHIKPRSKGFSLDGNLALVCCRCNTDKGLYPRGNGLPAEP